MRSYKTQGIVLRRVNTQEVDRIITLFSLDKGKIRILAKGVRKINSRRAPHLEIFSHIKVVIYQGKQLFYLTEAETIENFTLLRKNFRKIAIAYHLTEIIDKLVPDHEVNKKLYNDLIKILSTVNYELSFLKIRKEIRIFVYQLLVDLGYLNKEQKLTYSQLVNKIELIIEKPLRSLKLLIKLAKENKAENALFC